MGTRLQKSLAAKFLIAIFLISLLPAEAKADAAQVNNWIASLGNYDINKGGAMNIPGAVVGAVAGGAVSPLMQFVLVNSMMNKCIKATYEDYPRRRDPFKLATAKFAAGMCRIQKCFQQGMLLLLLPQLSGRSQYGGQAGQQSGQQMGAALAQAFQKDGACPGGDQGMSQALLAAFLK